jgi:hypothetical protein
MRYLATILIGLIVIAPAWANRLDTVLRQAEALGAPMAAVQRAIEISRQPVFVKKDVLAVFDISQPSANKRFYVLDLKSGRATAHYAAHGKHNGPGAQATKFKGFQTDLDMVPLGPLKTDHSIELDPYKTIVDRYDGTIYRNMIVVVLEGVTTYNKYINENPPFKWVIQRRTGEKRRLYRPRSGRKQRADHTASGRRPGLRDGRRRADREILVIGLPSPCGEHKRVNAGRRRVRSNWEGWRSRHERILPLPRVMMALQRRHTLRRLGHLGKWAIRRGHDKMSCPAQRRAQLTGDQSCRSDRSAVRLRLRLTPFQWKAGHILKRLRPCG